MDFKISKIGVGFFSLALLCGVLPTVTQADDNSDKLKGKRIAILVADGFEYSELVEPKKALDAAGAKTSIVSPNENQVKSWKSKNWGESISVDVTLKQAKPEDFDALLLPGGVINPDTLRANPEAIRFVRTFADAEKPIAAICHGPWTLVEADVVRGRKLTSWPSLKTDIQNAGGKWSDAEVICDKNLITSRKPDDIPAFNQKMIEAIAGKSTK